MKTLLAFVALTICCFSYSQDYPVKPIRLVVPYSPGGPVDIVGRIVAPIAVEGIENVRIGERSGAAQSERIEAGVLGARCQPQALEIRL